MNAIDKWKRHTHTACYYDLVPDKASILQGYMSNDKLIISFYEKYDWPTLHDLANTIKTIGRDSKKYFVSQNEPLFLMLGDRYTTQIAFNPEVENAMLAYERAFKSLCNEDKIRTLQDVDLTNDKLCINAICLLLQSFHEYLFKGKPQIQLAIPPGGKIQNPFAKNYV